MSKTFNHEHIVNCKLTVYETFLHLFGLLLYAAEMATRLALLRWLQQNDGKNAWGALCDTPGMAMNCWNSLEIISCTPHSRRYIVERVLHVAGKVLVYTDGLDQAGFVANGLIYDATLRNLELIGEAATHIPNEVRAAVCSVGGWR